MTMSIMIRVVSCSLLCWASVDSLASEFCAGIQAKEFEASQSEREILTSVCEATPESFNGVFAYLERGEMPIPSYFHLKLPSKAYISMAPARGRVDEEVRYGILIISSEPQNSPESRDSVESIESQVLTDFRSQCNLPVEAWTYEMNMPGTAYRTAFSEARLGQTIVLIGGKSEDLLLVMIDAFRRLNCNASSTSNSVPLNKKPQ